MKKGTFIFEKGHFSFQKRAHFYEKLLISLRKRKHLGKRALFTVCTPSAPLKNLHPLEKGRGCTAPLVPAPLASLVFSMTLFKGETKGR